MKTNPWFRLYNDLPTDWRIEALSFEDQRHFVFLMCFKNAGILDADYPNDEVRTRTIARKLGLQGEALDSAKKRLVEIGLIDQEWQPIAWDRRQFRSDNEAERKRKYRERKRKEAMSQECPNDVPTMSQDTSHEVSQGASGDVHALEAEADTDTELTAATTVNNKIINAREKTAKFQMYPTWMPSDALASVMEINGYDASQITLPFIAEFRVYWSSGEREAEKLTQAAWEHRIFKWFCRRSGDA